MIELVQRQSKASANRIWRISRLGDKVTISHGQEGGEFQETSRTCPPVNVGKSNEKSGEVTAQEFMDRQILLKTRKGYRPAGEEVKSKTEIDFTEIPDNVRFWKPQNSLNAYLRKLIEARTAWWVRKRDGNQHSILVDDKGDLHMYSSTMQPAHKDEPDIPWLARYPVLEASLRSMDLPPKTILLGELSAVIGVDEHGFHQESLEAIGTIIKGKRDHSLLRQEEIGAPWFAIWDISAWAGNMMGGTASTATRLMAIHSLIKEKKPKLITHPEIFYFENGVGKCLMSDGTEADMPQFDGSEESALFFAKELGWEGWVVQDPAGVYEERAVNFAGKADRPKFAAKCKPKFEADFMVRWDPDNGQGTWGKGKKAGGVGAVFAYLWDGKGWQYVSKVGGGLSAENVAKFADPSIYPMVWKVEFASWTDKGSIQFPEFISVREDKLPRECTVDQIPEEIRSKL
jgi:hypothetical protein